MKVHFIVLPFVIATFLISCASVPSSAPPTAMSASPTAGTSVATTTTGPKRGGKVTVAVWQSPVTLNSLIGNQTVMNVVLTFVNQGMTQVLGDGRRIPVLAKEVPTPQNGGVSTDGKTIIYHLKEGVRWSDGNPFTCDDVKYHWQAVTTKGVGVVSTSGYDEIDTVECPDPLTAVVKFKNFYAPYVVLFGGIVPKSAGDPKNMPNWEYNRKPIGTGPFKLDEWVADSHIILSRNQYYHEKDKPYLDQVVIRIVPSSEVAMQLLASGEVDVMWNNTEADVPLLNKTLGVKISASPLIGGERFVLNLAENKDSSDQKKPHLILNDQRVRQAIAYGINKQVIIDKLLNGKAKLGTTDLNLEPYSCTDIKPYPYDPDKARQLLTEAGWVPGPDGIRIAKGAKVAPDGTRLRLKYSTTSGEKLREDTQVLMVESIKSIGVEMFIENAPSSVVLGTWQDASPKRRGNFDIVQYSTNSAIDPQNFLVARFHSKSIASETNKNGLNESRFANPRVDELLDAAGKEPDQSKRKVMYCEIARTVYEQANMIYLYQRTRINSFRDRLQGLGENGWDNLGWDSAGWWLK